MQTTLDIKSQLCHIIFLESSKHFKVNFQIVQISITKVKNIIHYGIFRQT